MSSKPGPRPVRSRFAMVPSRHAVILSCLSTIWHTLASPGYAEPAALLDRPESEALAAPGPDTDATITLFEKLIKRQDEADKPLANLRLEGRCSDVLVAWAPGKDEERAPAPEPEWKNSFLIVTKNGKRRAEFHPDPPGQPAYRLFDGKSLFGLNPGSLSISGAEGDLDKTWAWMLRAVQDATNVNYYVEFGPLKSALKWYINALRQDQELFEKGGYKLRCFSDGGEIVVDLYMPNNTNRQGPGVWSTWWIDPKQGFHVVRSTLQQGAAGSGQYNVVETSVKYDEIAAGVFCVASGKSVSSGLGTVRKERKGAGWRIREFRVAAAEFGDFEYDEALFDSASLPIKHGIPVTDRRVDPPLRFIYGEAPLDEQVRRAASRRHGVNSGSGSMRGAGR